MYDHQLDTFLIVARTGSFSQAARESYISPSAVSQQMRLLEDRLGVKLFLRSKQGITLTEAGRTLRDGAPELIRIARALTCSVRARRPLRLGWHTGLEDESFMRACLSLRDEGLDLCSIEAQDVFGALSRAEIDLCAYLESPLYASMGFEFVATGEARQVVVVPPGHPLEGRACLSIRDLAGFTLYLLREGVLTDHDALASRVREMGVDVQLLPQIDYGVSTQQKLFSMQAAFLGVDRFSWQYLPLRVLPLTDGVPVRIGLVCRKGKDVRLERLKKALTGDVSRT